MVIRPATVADAPALLSIYTHYILHTAVTFEIEPPTVEEFRGRIEKTLRRYPYLAAEEEGRVLGYAYAAPVKTRAAYDWSSEVSIYLDKDQRGRGVGKALYAVLFSQLRAMGIQNLYATICDTDREDPYLTKASPRFHEREGFTLVGRHSRCGYKFDRWYDLLWMEKLIGDHPVPAPPIKPWGGVIL